MDGKSKDLTKEYIEQIKGLFPEAVTEVADSEGNCVTHRVDMEKLAILLGDAALPTDETEYRQKYGEKFSFEWAGKRRAIAEAQKRSTGTLRPCPEESVDWDTTENLYIEGDNLEVLKLLQDSYLGEVKMIYIDPPYNTGKDFVYKDNYKDNLANYLEQTNTTNAVNSEASGRYHTNWLNMMYPRLKLARNLLTDDGVIFISIDDNEVSNLKSICDEIFGEENFVCQFVWKTDGNFDNQAKIKICHEYIVLYSKKASLFNYPPVIDPNISTTSKLHKSEIENTIVKNGPKNPFSKIELPIGFPCEVENCIIDERYDSWPRYYNSASIHNYKLMNPVTIESGWSSKSLITKFIDNKMEPINDKKGQKTKFVISATGAIEAIKERSGVLSHVISLLQNMGGTQKATSELLALSLTGFDYPKPTVLIEYLLKMLENKDSIILDFFSGSATTAHAVMQLNAEDGGNRKYICVQLPEPTPEDSEARKAGFETIPEIAKERIRRAGKKILEEQKVKNEGLFAEEVPKLDIGFKVFKLDRSNVKDWDVEFEGLSEKQAEVQLKAEFSKAMEILKDGRTELDLLYEVMLKLGLELSSQVSEKEIEGKTAYLVGNGVMVASFAKELTYGQISKILDLKPDFIQAGEFKVVFADESFASDNDKTNAIQLFKQRGFTNHEII